MYNIISLLIGFFYIAMGIFIIVYKFFVVNLEGMVPYVLGGLVIAYGVFRIGRAVYYLKNKDKE